MKFWKKFSLYTSEQKGVMGTLRTFLIRGALFLLPIAVSVFVAKWALAFVDDYFGGPTAALIRWIAPQWLLNTFADGHVPGMSMILLLLVLLILGIIASWRIGNRGLRLFDLIMLRVPLIGGIYASTRKIVETLGESNSFQRAVWFELVPGLHTVGFVTHEFIEETTGEKWVKIFYPLVPNPSAGMLVAKPDRETFPLDMDAKEVFTMMVALGTTMPDRTRIFPPLVPPPATPPEK